MSYDIVEPFDYIDCPEQLARIHATPADAKVETIRAALAATTARTGRGSVPAPRVEVVVSEVKAPPSVARTVVRSTMGFPAAPAGVSAATMRVAIGMKRAARGWWRLVDGRPVACDACDLAEGEAAWPVDSEAGLVALEAALRRRSRAALGGATAHRSPRCGRPPRSGDHVTATRGEPSWAESAGRDALTGRKVRGGSDAPVDERGRHNRPTQPVCCRSNGRGQPVGDAEPSDRQQVRQILLCL